MQHIDEPRLENDAEYRFQYLREFIGFSEEDVAAIHTAAMHLGPLIPTLVEGTYDQLLSFDATARHFMPRQHGYEGPLPESLDDLAQNSELIQFRKEHLTRYFMHLLGRAYDGKMAAFLDMAGKMHTSKAGAAELNVPLVQMNALLGLLCDVITGAIFELNIDQATKLKTARAFNKLLWLQNDFIGRHYQAEVE